MVRRLFSFGKSVALTLPEDLLAELGAVCGDMVSIELDESGKRLIISPYVNPAVSTEQDEDESDQGDHTDQYNLELDQFSY